MLLGALAVLGTPALLFAHAHLLRSSPAASAALTTPPRQLRLWFSERPELRFTVLTLADSAGAAMPLGPLVAIDSMGISAPIQTTMVPGKYVVTWRTAAADGHETNGKFTFSVSGAPLAATAPAAPAAVPQVKITESVTARPLPGSAGANPVVTSDRLLSMTSGMRWAELVALLTLVGLVTFRLAVITAAHWSESSVRDVNDRLLRFANALWVLFIVATLTRAFAEAELLPTSESRVHALGILVKSTQWGHGWAIGFGGAILLLIGLVIARVPGMTGWVIAAVGVIIAALGETLTGHSVTSSHPALAVASDIAHLLAGGGWLGGLAALMLAGLPSLKRLPTNEASAQGSRLLQAFHGTATECVILILVTAVISAWLRLGTFSALWVSPYGNMLLRKIFFVIVALGLGWYHATRIVPARWTGDVVARFRRSAAVELFIGLIIVAITALLVSMPLPK